MSLLEWADRLAYSANKKWRILLYERPNKVDEEGRYFLGWLIDEKRGVRYVFNWRRGRITYMREYKPPKDIPQYITRLIDEEVKKCL